MLTKVQDPLNDISVVFVHGILSSGQKCWTNENGTYWPNLIAQTPDLSGAGIYDFTFRADLANRNFNPQDATNSLKESLMSELLTKAKYLIFVCHSLGGLIVRQFLVQQENELLQTYRIHKVGLFLVASPSLGSTYANLITYLAALIGLRNPEADALKYGRDNIWLNTLDQSFKSLVDKKRLPIIGKELIEDEASGEPLKKIVSKQIVEYFSGARYFSDPYKVEYSDHFSIAKPSDSDAIQHKLLVAHIKQVLPKASETGSNPIDARQTVRAINLLHQLDGVLDTEINMFRSFAYIQKALEETFSYVNSASNDKAPRIPAKEKKLAELWEEARTGVYPYNSELAQLCSLGGQAWADFSVWLLPENRELLIRVKDKVERVVNLGEGTSTSCPLASFLGMTNIPRIRRKFGIFLPSFQVGGPLTHAGLPHEAGALKGCFQGTTYAVADIWAAWAFASLLVHIESPARVEWYPFPFSPNTLEDCSHHFLIGGKSNPRSMAIIDRSCSRFKMHCEEDSDNWLIEDTQAGKPYEVANPWKYREKYDKEGRDYGLIGRSSSQQKVHFFISGLGSLATEALGHYLIRQWENLATRYCSNDFVALFECHRSTPTRLICGETLAPIEEEV